jgi:hypothetical protein
MFLQLVCWPLASLFYVGNYPSALLFMLVAGVTAMRYYIDASIVLEETGTLALLKGKKPKSARQLWQEQSRLSEIVGNITRGRSRWTWVAILGFLGFVVIALFAGSLGVSESK